MDKELMRKALEELHDSIDDTTPLNNLLNERVVGGNCMPTVLNEIRCMKTILKDLIKKVHAIQMEK